MAKDDTFLDALGALEGVLADNHERSKLIKRRIAALRSMSAKNATFTEMVAGSDGPLIVQLLTDSSTALDTCGAQVRRAEAEALYEEGLTMEQIAEVFGVTRQRVSALLRRAGD